jgi:hypothetical protein
VVRAIYDRLVATAQRWGAVREEPKKTSIHLARKTAFAGVATRKAGIVLTLKSPTDIRSRRISKREQVSANRWHVEIKLDEPSQVDADIKKWL